MNILTELLKNKENVMIIGNYGDGNIGDEAMLDVISHELSEIGIKKIVVPSRNARKLGEIHDSRIKSIAALEIIREIFNLDAIVLGGGTLFSKYSGHLVYMGLCFTIVNKFFGRKIIFYGIGFSMSCNFIMKNLAKFAFALADLIIVRDEPSLFNIRSLKVKKNILIYPDLALKLKPSGGTTIHNILSSEDVNTNKKLVGVSLNNVKEKKINKHMENIFSEFFDLLIERYNFEILFFTFCPGYVSSHSDRDLGIRIKNKMQNKNSFRLMNYYPPTDTLALVGKMDLFIGMRFHSKVFAHKMGVPLIGIIYEEKCKEFIKDNNLIGFRIEDIVFDQNARNEFISRIFDECERISQ